MPRGRMSNREQILLKLVRRASYPLDVEFSKSPAGPYILRIHRKREVLIDISSKSLVRVQYDFAAAIVAIRRSGIAPECNLRARKRTA